MRANPDPNELTLAIDAGGVLVPLVIGLIIVGVVIVAGAVLALVVARRRARQRPVGPSPTGLEPNGRTTPELERLAAERLIAIDDRVGASETELQFARAEFGDAVVPAYAEAIQASRERVARAFDLRVKLDDEVPDTEIDRRAWLERIIALADESSRALDGARAEFAALDQGVSRVEADLDAVVSEAERARSSVLAASSAIEALRDDLAEEALAPFDAKRAAAQHDIDDAVAHASAAAEALKLARRGEAATELRLARGALGRVDDGVRELEGAPVRFREARNLLRAQLAEAAGSIEDAKRVRAAGGSSAEALAAIDNARDALEALIARIGDEPWRTPIADSAELQRVSARLLEATGAVSTSQRAAEQIVEDLPKLQSTARARIDEAKRLVRPGESSGALPRALLSQADDLLARSLERGSAEPARALRLAADALDAAERAGLALELHELRALPLEG